MNVERRKKPPTRDRAYFYGGSDDERRKGFMAYGMAIPLIGGESEEFLTGYKLHRESVVDRLTAGAE